MFNLELFELTLCDIKAEDVCVGATHIAYDSTYLFLLKNGRVQVYDTLKGAHLHLNHEDKPETLNCITKFSFLQERNQLWFGTGKQFIYVSPNNNAISVIDEESEFLVAEWNDSYDTLAIIYTNGEIRTYAVDLDNTLILLSTGHLNDQSVSSKSVAVGWGSEKTQFDHSKIKKNIGKKVANNAKEDTETDVHASQFLEDDKQPRLCWKPEGSMFAINYYDNGKRLIKIYDFDCKLLHIHDGIAGLQPFIAWRPLSTQMTSVVWTNKQLSLVTLGERPSLEQYFYQMHCNDQIEDLRWSSNGSELVIRHSNSKGVTSINLYTFLNFECYLKQCLQFTSENPLIDFELLKVSSQCAIQVFTFKQIATYFFKRAVHHSSVPGLIAAAINGQKLYLSFCKEGIIPSPLYHLVITTNSPINCITFHPQKQILAALDAGNTLNIYTYSMEYFKLVQEYNIPCSNDIPLRIRNVHWQNDKQIVCLQSKSRTINQVYVLNMFGEPTEWNFIPHSSCSAGVNYTKVLQGSETLITQTSNAVSLIDPNGVKAEMILPTMALYLDSVTIDSNVYVFGLTHNHVFMVNNNRVHEFVASFIVHDKYLILVTEEHQLIVVKLSVSSLNELCNSKFEIFYTRPIDHGSKLLFVIPNTSNIIMENRRGNFELYTCRVITIDRVEAFIKEGKWREALHTLSLDKVDTNVIVDLDVERFITNVHAFVEQVQTQSILNEFLIDLRNNNIFETVYKDSHIDVNKENRDKCTLVCDAIINVMQEYNYVYYIESITIAEIMKTQPSVRGALEHINYLLSISTKELSFVKKVERILQTIQTLKPNLKLYETALSMYNLDLAAFIAPILNIDKAEYLPLLSTLKKMDEIQLRFTINKHLQQFRTGLPYCIKLCQDDEVYKYIIEHDLAKYAYPLINKDSALFGKVIDLASTMLSAQKKYDEAAAIQLYAGFKFGALKEYAAGLFWKEALQIMQDLNIPQATKLDLLSSIITGLVKRGNIIDASFILDEHLDRYEEAIHILIKCNMFTDAVHIAEKHNRSDILENDIQLALQKYLEELLEKLPNLEETFNKYKNRLLAIRKQKEELYYRSTDLNQSETVSDNDDIQSRDGSTISTLSTRTSRSGVTLRQSRTKKIERKKEDLREGAHYEDIALIKILYKLIEETFKYGPQVRSALLVSFSLKHTVKPCMEQVQTKLFALQTNMLAAVKDIWNNEMNEVQTDTNKDVILFVYLNISNLDVQYRVPPPNLQTNWTLEILHC